MKRIEVNTESNYVELCIKCTKEELDAFVYLCGCYSFNNIKEFLMADCTTKESEEKARLIQSITDSVFDAVLDFHLKEEEEHNA